ncbi:hypothetical protein DM860_017250 [Cuscuta australis]|uniref:Uncharacterized protein n=1 Tax=Cuscuta australis TaxID=267555 RepID=A0A328E524_9ASTE|nr:hypothetical protein DM860_017250 [Cuscuta australis]
MGGSAAAAAEGSPSPSQFPKLTSASGDDEPAAPGESLSGEQQRWRNRPGAATPDIEHGIMVLKDPFSSEKVVESRFINWPCGRTREDIHHVAATGGYIHYLLLASKEALQLWRLSDYARGDWTLVQKLHLNDNELLRVVNSTHFIYLHPFKPEVAIFVTTRCIFLVNIEEKKILEQGQYSMSSLMLEYPLVIP